MEVNFTLKVLGWWGSGWGEMKSGNHRRKEVRCILHILVRIWRRDERAISLESGSWEADKPRKA